MRFVLLLIAAVVAVIAGVVALQMTGKNTAPVAQSATPAATSDMSNVATAEVLVARQAIPVGTVIEASMVDKQPWPSHLVLEGFVTGDSSAVVGKVARAPFAEREPFIAGKIANPNDPSFLAATLPAGMRAVSVATDPVSGVAGYVFPGDRVDVLLTHNVDDEIRKQSGVDAIRFVDKPEAAEVLVSNARVLAVNVRPSGKEGIPSTTPSSVTLEVTQPDAQRIRLAEKIGTVSLSLRSIKDQEDGDWAMPSSLPQLTKMRPSSGGDAVKIVRGAGPGNDALTAATPQPVMQNNGDVANQ